MLTHAFLCFSNFVSKQTASQMGYQVHLAVDANTWDRLRATTLRFRATGRPALPMAEATWPC